jgi:hypothetical protein
MARIDVQALADRVFSLSALPPLDVDIEDCGHRRSVTFVESRLLLQRRRSDGDGGRWRTVLKCKHTHMALVEEWVRVAQMLDAAVEWRMTYADGTPVPAEEQGEKRDI